MKKIIFVITFILAIILGWVYLANKFEKSTKNTIITVLDEYKEYVTYDSIKINKYSFSITLQKVKFNYIDYYSDEIVIRHIPFLNITKIDSYGNDVKITTTENEESIFYSPDHHITVWSRGSLLNDTSDFWQFSLNDNKSTIYSSRIVEKLTESTGGSITITYNKTADNLNLLEANIHSNTIFISENFPKEVLYKVSKLFQIDPKILHDTLDVDFDETIKLTQINLPANGNIKFNFKYSDELVTLAKLALRSSSQDKQKNEFIREAVFVQIATEIYQGKPFLLALDINSKGRIENQAYKLNLDKDKKINFSLNIGGSRIPSEVYEKEKIAILSKSMVIRFNKILDGGVKGLRSEPLLQNDFAKIIEPFVKIKDSKFSLEAEFDPKEKKLSSKINLVMDKFNFAVDFNLNNLNNPTNFAGVVTLSDPNTFIGNLTNYTNNAIVPVLKKIDDSKDFALSLAEKTAVLNQYGFDVATAFSKNSELKEGEPLVIDINRNDDNFTFNGKDYQQILSDERVIKFINAMNSLDQKRE